MLTKRKVRRLYGEAQRWYSNGIYSAHSQVAAPSGASPHRIAYEAGRQAAEDKNYTEMSLDVWVRVYADWLRKF